MLLNLIKIVSWSISPFHFSTQHSEGSVKSSKHQLLHIQIIITACLIIRKNIFVALYLAHLKSQVQAQIFCCIWELHTLQLQIHKKLNQFFFIHKLSVTNHSNNIFLAFYQAAFIQPDIGPKNRRNHRFQLNFITSNNKHLSSANHLRIAF